MATPVINAVRTIRNGTLTVSDGTSFITVNFMDGGLKGDLKKREYQPVIHRGTIAQIIELDDQLQSINWSMNVVELYSTAGALTTWIDLQPTEVLLATFNNAAYILNTSTGITGEPVLFNVRLVKAAPAGATSETILWTKCLCPSMEIEEGYPDRVSVSIISRGGPPTITYA